MIGQDGQQVLVKHGGSYVRVHLCRLLLEQAAFGQPMVDSQDEEEAIRVQQVASQTEKILKVSNVTHVNEESNKVVHIIWEILLKFDSFFATLL